MNATRSRSYSIAQLSTSNQGTISKRSSYRQQVDAATVCESLLMGNFSLLEIIISRLDDEDRYALAGYLSQVFAHHLSTFNIDWCMEMLMSQSTEIDRHSFILGQSNTGFCEIMIRNLISEDQTQKYMSRLLAPITEHLKNIDTEMKEDDIHKAVSILSDTFRDTIYDCPTSVRQSLSSLETRAAKQFPGKFPISTAQAFFFHNYVCTTLSECHDDNVVLRQNLSKISHVISEEMVGRKRRDDSVPRIQSESLAVMITAWRELVDQKEVQRAVSIVQSHVRYDPLCAAKSVAHLRDFLAGESTQKRHLRDSPKSLTSRSI